MAAERLQKIIAQAGIASRRAAEQYILDGRVKVNGQVVRELGQKADPDKDRIFIDGHGELSAEPLVYIALHKPIHVISTVQDPEGRTTVLDVVGQSRAVGRKQFEGELPRVYPVGRLDFDAEGLIILTNDGDLTNVLTHPKHHAPKTYMVKVSGIPEERQLERLRRGVRLRDDEGEVDRRATKSAVVNLVKRGEANSWLEITLFEGRNHQIKRMCDAIGHSTIRLIRVDFGGVALDPLPAGAWRFLTDAEVHKLKAWRTEGKAPQRPAPKKVELAGSKARPSAKHGGAKKGAAKGAKPGGFKRDEKKKAPKRVMGKRR